jgi:hypothetical protein
VARAGLVEVSQLGDVSVVGVPLDPRLLSDGAHGRTQGTYGPMQLDGRVDDPLAVCFWRSALRFITYFRAIYMWIKESEEPFLEP